jgi:hypothetical protein
MSLFWPRPKSTWCQVVLMSKLTWLMWLNMIDGNNHYWKCIDLQSYHHNKFEFCFVVRSQVVAFLKHGIWRWENEDQIIQVFKKNHLNCLMSKFFSLKSSPIQYSSQTCLSMYGLVFYNNLTILSTYSVDNWYDVNMTLKYWHVLRWHWYTCKVVKTNLANDTWNMWFHYPFCWF